MSQNVDNAEQSQIVRPQTLKTKQLQKIQNNRYLNQNIYQLFVLGRYEQCLSMISKCKNDEFKLYIKALIYKQYFQLEKSLQLLIECQVLNKTNFAYLKGISKNYYLLGKYKSSLQAAKQAYKYNTSDYQISFIMAKISLAMKDREGAIANLARAISKEPNEESYIMMSRLLMDKQNYPEAAAELKKSLNISPENGEVYEMLGEIYQKLGQQKESLRYYELSMEKSPDRYQANFAAAAIKQAEGDIQKALEEYKKAGRLSESTAAFWNNLAGTMLAMDKQIMAYLCLKKALFLDPFRWDVHTNLGFLLMRVKKYVGAQIHFRSALKLNKTAQIYEFLAICLCSLGDFSNAQKCYTQILQMSTQQKYKINYMCLLLKKGDKDRCRQIQKQLRSEQLSSDLRQKLNQISNAI